MSEWWLAEVRKRLQALASMRALTFLDLRKTDLSPEGLACLRKSLPKCTIVSE
jgi:hypothetical protein